LEKSAKRRGFTLHLFRQAEIGPLRVRGEIVAIAASFSQAANSRRERGKNENRDEAKTAHRSRRGYFPAVLRPSCERHLPFAVGAAD
jgi:hypothetical protein